MMKSDKWFDAADTSIPRVAQLFCIQQPMPHALSINMNGLEWWNGMVEWKSGMYSTG